MGNWIDLFFPDSKLTNNKTANRILGVMESPLGTMLMTTLGLVRSAQTKKAGKGKSKAIKVAKSIFAVAEMAWNTIDRTAVNAYETTNPKAARWIEFIDQIMDNVRNVINGDDLLMFGDAVTGKIERDVI